MRPMPIIRSRTGCFTCRRRKKKCNEEKPICSGCKRNRLECHWPTDGKATGSGSGAGASASGSASAAVKAPKPLPAKAISKPTVATTVQSPVQQQGLQQPAQAKPRPTVIVSSHPQASQPSPLHPTPASEFPLSPDHVSSGSDADMTDAHDGVASPPSPSSPPLPDTSGLPADAAMSLIPANATHDAVDPLTVHVNGNVFPDSDPVRLGVSMSMSMLPQHGHDSYELLSYYLSRTANSMGNGSTEVNPFVAKLIPLAFSDPLVLQLILAQSAAHRQASEERLPTDEVAQRYYTDSLRMFRAVVGDFVSGKDGNTLVLTVGSLILCLTEVAKGDIHGTIFDHLTASKSALQMLLARPKPEVTDDLPDFLVEYYMHMAACSMISIDPQYSSQPLLTPEIEHLARSLVEKKYVGQLCGCWLELLLLITQIFHLGQSMMVTSMDHPSPSPDDIMTFGFLQSQILAFFPDSSAALNARLAGLVFKQAVLLYLWTMLGTSHNKPENSAHKNFINTAVNDAIALLSQFPATVRINTSLCWPLAVIGCCTSDPAVQQVLRTRLQTMLDTIGLGNMRETLVLLEHVWKQPLEETSPWTLCKSMREHQIWISFA